MQTATSLKLPTTNRTILELKPGGRKHHMAQHRGYQSHHTGIETYQKTRYWPAKMALPIAPYWNWNYSHLGTGRKVFAATNRTILELKRWITGHNYRWCAYQSHHTGIETCHGRQLRSITDLPIAPYWNWNTALYFRAKRWATYQSHHTGIETWSDLMALKFWTPTNRTILELKLRPDCNSFFLYPTTNRTILELKLNIFLWPLKVKKLPIAPYWNWNRSLWSFC